MARIAFVTVYDQYSIGLRIMSRLLRDSGHHCAIIYLKLPFNRIIAQPHQKPIVGEFAGEQFVHWQLREYARTDCPWSEAEASLLLERLDDEAPDIIGYSGRSPLDKPSMPLLRKIRERFPDRVLVAGGLGPMFDPAHYLQVVDFVAMGEGEETILEMAEAIDRKAPLDGIANLLRWENGRVAANAVRKPADDLDRYPLPDFENRAICYIENDCLTETDPVTLFDPAVDTYPMLIGRGCIEKCSYCSAGRWTELYYTYGGHRVKPHRVRPVGHIMAELKAAKERGYRYISFIESHLAGPKPFLEEFFQRYAEEIGLPFTANLHMAQIEKHPELLAAACDAGLAKVPLGVQHGSEAFCREYFNRDVPNKLILDVARMLHERGIKVEYQFIAGIPFETEESLAASLEFVAQLPMAHGFLLVSRLRVFHDSPLTALLREKGMAAYVEANRWYFTALLYNLRTVLADAPFERVRRMTEAFARDRQGPLPALMSDYCRQLSHELASQMPVIAGGRSLTDILEENFLSSTSTC